MDKNRVFYIITSFKPLLNKVKEDPYDLSLTAQELEKVHQFISLWSDGWLDTPSHYKRAGLNKSDITLLIQLAQQFEPDIKSKFPRESIR